MCRLIGLIGPLGHGKTTAAHQLERHGFTLMRLADPLKEALITMGCTKEQVDGKLKEVPADNLCGKTPRHAMQTLGTEWARDMIGDDFWVRALQQRLVTLWSKKPDARVVIDDIRFPNEVAMILSNGGEVWRVVDPRKIKPYTFFERVRILLGLRARHISEVYWERILPHEDITNDGTIPDLQEKVRVALDDCDSRSRECRASVPADVARTVEGMFR